MINNIISDIKKVADPKRAKFSQRFFKTGKGEYGEGDIFIGSTIPDLRKISNKYKELSLAEIEKLLKSKIHDYRFVALAILCIRFKSGDEITRKSIFSFYLRNTRCVNSWDLVDMSAYKIVGEWLVDKDTHILFKLATSSQLWERRIAIVSTFAFIRRGECELTYKIAEILIKDRHDLIQKAVGWMLREAGKYSLEKEENFLKKYYRDMGRTALRYSIEKFPDKKRIEYLLGKT